MIRTNGIRVEVKNPTLGLFTRVPSNSPDRRGGRALTVAQNVRAERGVLMNAPGYEKIIPSPENLDSPANLIFQAEVLNVSPEIRTTPIIGTGGRIYILRRRAQPLICNLGQCRLTAALFGDTQANTAGIGQVRDLVVSWAPDIICHLGDMAYGGSGSSHLVYNIEETVGQYYHPYVGGYAGFYGVGPTHNRFFPVRGNHDWNDFPSTQPDDFFNLPGNKRYYTFKRGPVQFFVFSGYTGFEPDGTSAGSVQGLWLQAALAASDCPWRVLLVHFPSKTSSNNHYPGNADLEWLRELSGVTAVATGHSHIMEVVKTAGKAPILTCGTGGASLTGLNIPLVEGSSWQLAGQYGAMRLDATTDLLTFKFFTVDGTLQHTEEFSQPSESSGICYISDAARRPVSLSIRPSQASVEVGYSWQFEAWVTLEDGDVLPVTGESIWTSASDTVGAVGRSTGRATGRQVGSTQISVAYAGLTASASFEVLPSCLDKPLDVVFVVERSDSMGTAAGGNSSRMQETKEACNEMISALIAGDTVGLVSFSGVFASQTEVVSVDSVLTGDFETVKNRMALLVPNGSRSLAGALAAARAEITAHGRAAADKVAAVVICGVGDVVTGGDASSVSAEKAAAMAAASAQATLLKGDGVTVAVIGYDIAASELANVESLATYGYFFSVVSPEELKAALIGLPNLFCTLPDLYYFYETPSDPSLYSPQLDYQSFINWDVVDGVVDLCGEGTNGLALYDLLPGSGLYIDLSGTSVRNSPQSKVWEGKMQSKATFSFTAGKTYRFSLKLAGNRRQEIENHQVKVTIGTLLTQTVTIDDWQLPWTTYSWDFIPSADATSPIIVEQLKKPSDAYSVVGTFMDDVKLENVTDASVLLFDTFDSENPH